MHGSRYQTLVLGAEPGTSYAIRAESARMQERVADLRNAPGQKPQGVSPTGGLMVLNVNIALVARCGMG